MALSYKLVHPVSITSGTCDVKMTEKKMQNKPDQDDDHRRDASYVFLYLTLDVDEDCSDEVNCLLVHTSVHVCSHKHIICVKHSSNVLVCHLHPIADLQTNTRMYLCMDLYIQKVHVLVYVYTKHSNTHALIYHILLSKINLHTAFLFLQDILFQFPKEANNSGVKRMVELRGVFLTITDVMKHTEGSPSSV